MMEQKSNIYLNSMTGVPVEIYLNSCIFIDTIKDQGIIISYYKLSGYIYSEGGHRSKVSNVIISHHVISLHDINCNMMLDFECEDIESIVNDDKEKCELHIIYHDGTNVYVYDASKF